MSCERTMNFEKKKKKNFYHNFSLTHTNTHTDQITNERKQLTYKFSLKDDYIRF